MTTPVQPGSESAAPGAGTRPWSPDSWRSRVEAQRIEYPDANAVEREVAKLGSLPPLVTSWEIEKLKQEIADAQEGRRFVLQGGDCAETLDDCTPGAITNKLKILMQMSLALVWGGRKPVVRIGRFAGQYAKPRSSAIETREINGARVSLPSYFGDLVNGAPFTPEARMPNPHLLVRAYQHAALTLNFIRALVEGGFADIHHPEYWDLSFMRHASLPADLRAQYEQMTRSLADGLRFMEVLGEARVEELTRVEFFTSHEGLSLLYESAQTRRVPRREGHYNLSTHLPWIGERTRQIDGAHVEYFRGIQNPVGIKIGPATSPADVRDLVRVLNPTGERGKIVLITRLGAGRAAERIPALVEGVRDAGSPVLWICDPMHGNTVSTASGLKTRSFDAIRAELETTYDALRGAGAHMGGIHVELTGEDVTECVGGATDITEDNLHTNYATLCDPRLNYHQALELAFALARRLSQDAGK
ncbi:MAG: 3-deoxy-7-phosphoheptulonate synthase [Phycisphaeraceae bacterium]|nr:3-deoxy-7-phosphoheptulonate synthase [Phycisphaeraceae bacterium]MBX3368529.1 3-deoxy-7-phosphoheptulonate synthase [Phycisphaeraceae bacterium]